MTTSVHLPVPVQQYGIVMFDVGLAALSMTDGSMEIVESRGLRSTATNTQ